MAEAKTHQSNFVGDINRLYFDARSAPVVYRQPQFMQNRYKIALLGARRVGKTAIFNRLCYDTFVESTDPTLEMKVSTISADEGIASVSSSQSSSSSTDSSNNLHVPSAAEIMAHSMTEEEPPIIQEVLTLSLPDKTRMTVDIVDVPGATNPLSVLTLRNCSGVALVYSIDDENSWKHVDTLMRQLRHCCPPDCDVLLLGNKCDRLLHPSQPITRRVPLMKTNEYATSHGCSLYECSAQNGYNVRDGFTELVLKLREKTPMGEYEVDGVDNDGMHGASITKSQPSFAHTRSSWCMFKCW